MSKPDGTSAVHSQATGPTFTENDPAKFRGEGKRSGKTAANGVIDQSTGATFTENSTHIPTIDADKPARESKVIRDGKAPQFVPDDEKCAKDASSEGSGGGLPYYPLKDSYEKRGRKGAV